MSTRPTSSRFDILSLLAAATIALTSFSLGNARAGAAVVPSLLDDTLAVARQKLKLRRLEMVRGTVLLPAANWRPELVEGHIIAQFPIAGTQARGVRSVAVLTIQRDNTGNEPAKMPKLIGTNINDAKKTISDAKLQLITIDQTPGIADIQAAPVPGAVIDQFPAADQPVLPGSTVVLHVVRNSK